MNQQETVATANAEKKCRRLIVGYGTTDKPGVEVPCVRLRGRWLQDAGFVIGRHVKIEVSEGRLLIEQVD
jgi:toxic protein SymE